MPFDQLGDFLTDAADHDELLRISESVASRFEIAETTRLVTESQTHPPVLLFERVAGHDVPVVTNLLGTPQRWLRAAGVSRFDEAVDRLSAALSPQLGGGWLDSVRRLPQLSEQSRLQPRVLRSAACQQIVKLGRDIDLKALPIPHAWSPETGPIVTRGVAIMPDGEDGRLHASVYRAEVAGADTLQLHWTSQDRGSQVFEEHRRSNRQLPLALVLGGDPLLAALAASPFVNQLGLYLFAGVVRNEGLNLVRGRTVELDVPADAEFVIEGYLDPGPTAAGVAANRLGDVEDNSGLATMRVTAITHRANPVLPATIYGPRGSEVDTSHRFHERLLLRVGQLLVPDLLDLKLPVEGRHAHVAWARIRKRYPHQARQVMMTLWSLPGLTTVKCLVVVDEDIDLNATGDVWQSCFENVHPTRDLLIMEGPADMADAATPQRGQGAKMGWDATRKLAAEGHSRSWPQKAHVPEEVTQKAELLLKQAGWSIR